MNFEFNRDMDDVKACFFCRTVRGGAGLDGKIRLKFNYEPCEECKKKWDKGMPVLEMSDTPLIEGQPPLEFTDSYPTGRYMVMNKEALDVDKDATVVLMKTEDFKEVLKDAQKVMEDKNIYEIKIKL